MGRRGIATLAALAALVGVGITQAGAAPFPVTPTQLTIQANFSGPIEERPAARGGELLTFSGKVLSRKARCKRNRTVILFAGVNEFSKVRGKAARRAPRGFVPMNAVKSNRRGNWMVAVAESEIPRDADGRFVARVTRKRAFRARCRQARSEVIDLAVR